MPQWYVCDVIKTAPPSGGTSIKEVMGGIYPMLFIDTLETWVVTHIQSGTTRNVTFGGLKAPTWGELGFAYETDHAEPEVCLIRAEDAIAQEILDEVNAVGPGGTFIVHIDTIAERNALYAAYPSLIGRFPDQP